MAVLNGISYAGSNWYVFTTKHLEQVLCQLPTASCIAKNGGDSFHIKLRRL